VFGRQGHRIKHELLDESERASWPSLSTEPADFVTLPWLSFDDLLEDSDDEVFAARDALPPSAAYILTNTHPLSL
jgi:hypothetical protein